MTRRSCSTSRPRKSSSSAIAAALLLGLTATAAAEDFAPHVQKAQACYDAKDFDCAVRELQAAFQIKAVPGLLLNIGHAHLDAGRPQEALTFYNLYLQSEKKLTPAIRAEVDKFRAQARERLQAPTAPTPTPAPDPLQAPTPTATPPGPTPAPSATAEPANPTATAEPPTATAPVAPPTAPAAAAQPSRAPGGALALVGVGAGLLIVGLGLGGGALATAGQVTSDPGPFNADLDTRGRTLSYAGAAFDVLGGLALVSGVAWTVSWAVGRHKEKAPAQAVSVRPGVAGVLALGRF